MATKRDITAVVLSIGEPYTDRAIASLQRQTLPVADTVVVRGVTPFHHALNAGAAQVRTPFFVQIDADTILDDTCLEELRSRMCDTFGLVSGLLRDPIVGRTQGTRLYRTQCFEHVQIRDTISPDMDFAADIQRHGWGRLHALRYQDERQEHWHTFGDHRPDYNPLYTFCKFLLTGVRSRYRRKEGKVRLLFQQLRTSNHSAATIGLIAAAHGLFRHEQHDLLAPYRRTMDFDVLDTFLAAARDGADDDLLATHDAESDLCARFKRAYERGIHYRRRAASGAFMTQLQHLKQRDDLGSWLALVGMCHGLFLERYRETDADEAYASLAEIVAAVTPW